MDNYNTPWTEAQEKVIADCVAENPANISDAIGKASRLIGRTYTACLQRWYCRIKHNTEVFTLSSGNATHKNTKNIAVSSSNEDTNVSAEVVEQETKPTTQEFVIRIVVELQ
mgnify:CR=1 FL=1